MSYANARRLREKPITARFSFSILGSSLIIASLGGISCNRGPDVIDVGSPLVTPPDFSAVVSGINLQRDASVSGDYARLEATLLNQLEPEPGEGAPPRVIVAVPNSTRVFLNDSRQSLARPQDIRVGDSIRVWRTGNPRDSVPSPVPTYAARQIVLIRHARVAPQKARPILLGGALVVGAIAGPLITLGVAQARRRRRAAGTDTAIARLISEAVALVAGALAFGLIGMGMVFFPYCAGDAIVVSAIGAFGGLVAAGVGMKQGLRAARPSTDWIPGVMAMAPSALVTAYNMVMCQG